MALTPEQIDSAYRKVWSTVPHAQRLSAFALEIEAEVRKQDDALILQLAEALESVDDVMPFPVARQVLKVARARLDGMHGIKGGQP